MKITASVPNFRRALTSPIWINLDQLICKLWAYELVSSFCTNDIRPIDICWTGLTFLLTSLLSLINTTSNFPHIGTNFLHAITNPSWLLIMVKSFYLHDLLAWNCFSAWSWRRSLWWSYNFLALCRYMPFNHLSSSISSSTVPFNACTNYLSEATQT